MFLLIITYNWYDISEDFTLKIEINVDFREKIVEVRRLDLRAYRFIKLSASPPLSEQPVLLSAVGHFGASVVQLKMADGVEIAERKSCAFFLKRKNRFCRMTVGGGRRYCGEHMVVAGEAEVRNLFLFLRHCFGSTYSFSTSL